MRPRAFCYCVAVLAVLISSGCNQTAAPQKSASDPSAEKPQPLKYVVKVESPAEPTQAPAANADRPVEQSATDPQTAEVASPQTPLAFRDPQATELTLPTVALSSGHAETCRVKVGDTLPELQLVDFDGQEQSLDKLKGAKLSVVLFWNAAQPNALEELADLGPDVLARFSGYGVAVIGINTGDEAQLARELATKAEATYPNLSDPQGTAWAQVATAKIPRTYLIDAAGKIVWFDIEYSRTTRRELAQAIRFALSHDAPSPAATP